jgi:hypothetical protein
MKRTNKVSPLECSWEEIGQFGAVDLDDLLCLWYAAISSAWSADPVTFLILHHRPTGSLQPVFRADKKLRESLLVSSVRELEKRTAN